MDNFFIYAEQNSASDDEIEILKINLKNGDYVKKNQILFEAEGAKAVFEIEAAQEGFFYSLINNGDKVKIGQKIALISGKTLNEQEIENLNDLDSKPNLENNIDKQSRFSAPALEKLKEFSLDISLFDSYEFVTLDLVLEKVSKLQTEKKVFKKYLYSPNKSGKKLLILGGGGGAVQIFHLIMEDHNYNLIGVADDNQNFLESFSVPLIDKLDMDRIKDKFDKKFFDSVILGITSNMEIRKNIYDFCIKNDISIETVISKDSKVSKLAKVGSGSLIMDLVNVGPLAVIKDNVFISSGVDIEHHCQIGENTTFGPGVFLSGGVTVGKNTKFGTGVFIEPGLTIGNNCVIASGTTITKNIADNSVVKNRNSIIVK